VSITKPHSWRHPKHFAIAFVACERTFAARRAGTAQTMMPRIRDAGTVTVSAPPCHGGGGA